MIGIAETWKQTFIFDRYGNRNFDEANTTANAVSFPKTCGTTPNFTMCAADKKIYNPAIDTSNNNRLSTSDGYTFDAAGNTTKDANSRKFDSFFVRLSFLCQTFAQRLALCLRMIPSRSALIIFFSSSASGIGRRLQIGVSNRLTGRVRLRRTSVHWRTLSAQSPNYE